MLREENWSSRRKTLGVRLRSTETQPTYRSCSLFDLSSKAKHGSSEMYLHTVLEAYSLRVGSLRGGSAHWEAGSLARRRYSRAMSRVTSIRETEMNIRIPIWSFLTLVPEPFPEPRNGEKRKTSGYLGLESHFHANDRVRI